MGSVKHKLCGDGPGSVDVVPGHHADGDAGSLALRDRGRHLRSHRVLKQSRKDHQPIIWCLQTKLNIMMMAPQCRLCRRRSCLLSHCPPPSPQSLAPSTSRNEPGNISTHMLSSIPLQIWARSHLVLLRLGGHKVPVGQADGSQAVLGHRLDHSLDQPVENEHTVIVWPQPKHSKASKEREKSGYQNLSWWCAVKLSTLPFSANRKLHFFITISDAPFVYTLKGGSLMSFLRMCVSPESSCVKGNDGAHGLASRVESVNLLEPRVRHVASHLLTVYI